MYINIKNTKLDNTGDAIVTMTWQLPRICKYIYYSMSTWYIICIYNSHGYSVAYIHARHKKL